MFLHHAPEGVETPASFERPVDLVHLARQTLGDRALEREILDLFVIQTRAVLDHLHAAEQEQQKLDLAHTLKGSARAVGAWKVAACAESCELVANDASVPWKTAVDALESAIQEVCTAIGDIQAMH
jgi:HPt (histidine-containing phosphotransfer) domain-containing protein